MQRVELAPDTDLREILEAVQADKTPRLIERNGEAIAVISAPEDFLPDASAPKSRLSQKQLLALAGAWRDVDADRLIEHTYRARHEAPPSPPVTT
jgi:hypothetical protein